MFRHSTRQATNRLRALTLGTVCALAAAASNAAPTVYFGLENSNHPASPNQATAARNSFVAAAGAAAITTQNYDSVATGEFATTTTGVLANGVGVTVTKSTVNGYLRVAAGLGTFNTYPTSGNQYLETLSDQGSTYFTVVFDHAVSGLGFFVSDVSDWVGDTRAVDDILVVLTTTAGDTLVLDLTPGFAPSQLVDGNLAFFGVIDTAAPFTSLAIRSGSGLPGADALGFDDFMVSLAVPEPGVPGLVLLAALAATAVRRAAGTSGTARAARRA
jgi:hypothetical protein